jgi:hypothetical protein
MMKFIEEIEGSNIGTDNKGVGISLSGNRP